MPTIRWSRDDGPMPESAIIGDGLLIIPSVSMSDAGTYTCRADNEAGTISSKVVLYVLGNKSQTSGNSNSIFFVHFFFTKPQM